jgi:hypothetical protein
MKLAVLSLILMSGTVAVAQQSSPPTAEILAWTPTWDTPPPNRAEALKKVRMTLEKGVAVIRAYSDYVSQQLTLGAIQERDTYEAKAAAPRIQSVLAAFDAGLFMELPKSPATPEAQKAREDYRKALLSSDEMLKKNYEAALAKYKLGISQQVDVISASMRLLDIEIQVAAFDAGLSYTPFLAAVVRG